MDRYTKRIINIQVEYNNWIYILKKKLPIDYLQNITIENINKINIDKNYHMKILL